MAQTDLSLDDTAKVAKDLRQYLLVTANYWAFTLTDGALRMLVILYFHNLGYNALTIAFLFLFYEFFGMVTNLVGGYLGARLGLNRIMHVGLLLQIIALSMLLVPSAWLTIAWVMAAQALSGIAKDLNKMSAKSAVKLLVPKNANSRLFRWVAVLTGSKNTLKGCGFFLGSSLLMWLDFYGAVLAMVLALSAVWLASLIVLNNNLGKSKQKPKFKQIFSKSPTINWLSGARLLLFGARDVWFVVALPVYLSEQTHWDYWQVGAVLAVWVIVYGMVQAAAPWLLGAAKNNAKKTMLPASTSSTASGFAPVGRDALLWVLTLALIPALLAYAMSIQSGVWVLLLGLAVFGVIFALNSAVHSYLIVYYAASDNTSLDVGFYYMANAAGRLLGTVLSGLLYVYGGLEWCLIAATMMLLGASLCSRKLCYR